MARSEYDKLYATEKELKKNENSMNGDEFVAALTFDKNINGSGGAKDDYKVPKGAAFCLPSSGKYKLAIASAKRRWEIEWISSKWYSENMEKNDENQVKGAYDGCDDFKEQVMVY